MESEKKKSFVLYGEYIQQVSMLSDEQAGKLLKGLLTRANDDPVGDFNGDGMVEMAYAFITAQIDRDNEKWEKKKKARSENGSKGGRPPKNSKKAEDPESEDDEGSVPGHKPEKKVENNYIAYMEIFKENIDYEGYRALSESPVNDVDMDLIDGIVTVAANALSSDREYIKVCGQERPASVVQSSLLKINSDYMGYVLDNLKKVENDIKYPESYILTVLYKASTEMSIAELPEKNYFNSQFPPFKGG